MQNEELMDQLEGLFAGHTSVCSTDEVHLALTSFLFLKTRFLFFEDQNLCSCQFSFEFQTSDSEAIIKII